MSDQVRGLGPKAAERDEVERLLELAGRRQRLPEHEVAPAREAARAAWKRGLRRSAKRRVAQFVGLAASVTLIAILVVRDRAPAPDPVRDSVALGELLVRAGDVRVNGQVGASPKIGKDATIVTGRQGRAALELVGGASLRIDVSTSVRFDSLSQVALDRGAVYLDVHPSSTRSSIAVETPLGTVRHLGTQFEVRLLEASEGGKGPGALRVTVREGSVSVEHEGATIEAGAGTELTLRSDGSTARNVASPQGPAWSWTQEVVPEHSIEGHTLASYLAWVTRETGFPFSYADAGLEALARETVLHGAINGLAPEESLGVVLPGCGLGHSRSETYFRLERTGAR